MESTACTFCGDPSATKIADQHICDDCYIARGSCCAEWFEESESPPPRALTEQVEVSKE
jgi:hypothetical protein